MRRGFRALAVLLVGVVLSSGVPAASQPTRQDHQEVLERIAELRRLSEELAAEEASIRGGIAANAERREALTEELAELQALVEQAEGRLDAEASELAEIQADLDATSDELEAKERALDRTLDRVEARAVEVYKRGPASLFELVFGAQGVGDLLQRFQYTLRFLRADNARVAEISELKAQILAERDRIAGLRDEAAGQVAVVRSQRDHVATIEGTVSARHDEVAGELEAQYAALGDVEAQREQYRRETEQLQAESTRIAAFLKGRGGGPANVGRGGMMWPSDGPLTSGYGWREHPIFGTRRFHAGIDIGAPTGDPIRAASAGTVLSTDAGTGYGNSVILDHGGGIATLYAHMSSIGVSVGQTVARGANIGAVGCTGYCTGPHLHFEVRVDGEPDDPMGWLPPR